MALTWRDAKGFESTYEVSSDGRVRRKAGFWCRTNRPKALMSAPGGYLRVSLSAATQARRGHKVLVHRLVYETFVGPIPAGLTINHRNGNKADNHPVNLELATMSEQMRHAYATGLQRRAKGEARGPRVAILTDEAVREIRRLFVPRRRGVSRGLANRFGVSVATIQAVGRGARWGHV